MKMKNWFEDLLEEGVIAHGMDQEVIQNKNQVHESIDIKDLEEVQHNAAASLLGRW